MVGFIIPALAIAYSLATSAYAVVNLPHLIALANEHGYALPELAVMLFKVGALTAGAVSLVVAVATAIPCFLSTRAAVRVVGGAVAAIPSAILSSLVFLGVYLPLAKMAEHGFT